MKAGWWRGWLVALAFFPGFGPNTAPGAEAELVPNDKCLECHGLNDLTRTNANAQVVSLYTDEAVFRVSVHGTNACVDCHRDLATSWEHPDDGKAVAPVSCAGCHERQSLTYNASVHAAAVRNGSLSAASCKDCHGSHDVRGLKAADSPLNIAKLAATCGQCHTEAEADLEASVHGKAAARGHREAPTCIDCHAEHQIEGLHAVSSLKIAGQICGKCHASERLNTNFRLPRRQVETFFQSYHGLAAQGGSTKAANCASCHGWHKILPSADPDSSVHRDHLVATCGQCHPGAGANFALGQVHLDDTSDSGVGLIVNRWVRRAYLALIVVVVGLLGAHNAAAWWKKVRAAYRAEGRTVVRMDRSQRRQHLVLVLSFVLLAVTGFALRFPDSPLSWALGTEDVRRWLHRVAGLVLLGAGFWHLGYLILNAQGRRLWRDLQLKPQDWRDVRTNTRYLAGRTERRARFGRFGYPEKLEYWAVVWGTIIMGVTGLMIWFKIDVTRWLPRWIIDVAGTVHYYEAILACLAIVVWHFYHVIFDPGVYPGNFAWLDGKVSAEWQRHEHPLETLPAAEALAGPPTVRRRNGDPGAATPRETPVRGPGLDPP